MMPFPISEAGQKAMRKLSWAGLTDVGKKRTENEDAFVVDPDLGIYVVCDGMGGHASGEVASAMTTEEIHAFFANRDAGDRSLPYQGEPGATAGELVISNAIQHANDKVYIAGMRDSKLEGMGTTVVAVTEWEDKLVIAHVGDSRIYRFREGKLDQVTRDHSLLNHKIDLGELTTQEEIDTFKHGNVIVRAIGLKDYVRPETSLHDRIPGDVYVLCSDGLSDMVDDWSIENVLDANADDLDEAVKILVRMANDRGGKDNITAVLVRVDDEPDEAAEGDVEEYDEGEVEHYDHDEVQLYEADEDGNEPTIHRSNTVPSFNAYRDREHETTPAAYATTQPVAKFKDITDDSEERTAPHSPVFAWSDDEDEDDSWNAATTKQSARPQPTPRTAPTVQDQRRRTQPTEELPSIIVDDDEA